MNSEQIIRRAYQVAEKVDINCYPSGTVVLAQLGVLKNVEAAVAR